MQARSGASVFLVAPTRARVLSPSNRGEALVSGGYQIAFQANIAYGPWFVDDRPRDTSPVKTEICSSPRSVTVFCDRCVSSDFRAPWPHMSDEIFGEAGTEISLVTIVLGSRTLAIFSLS